MTGGSTVDARGSILLADDEERIRRTLARALREDGHEVVTTPDGREARALLADRPFDLLVVDHRMPGMTGLELIREVLGSAAGGAAAGAGEGDRPQVIMMTAHATVENAIEAMKLGAFDYLQKPFEVDELLVAARRAIGYQRLRGEHRYLLAERDEEFSHYGIVGKSRAVQEVLKRIDLVAESRSTVLVTGETGTGKELVARAIHDRSAQRAMPLVKVSCAAIPETLIESELFGHVRGAFTGASSSRKGKFVLADGGTILLDEIATVAPATQAKLLRVLQEREVEPLGSERSRTVDVRVIAATNRDLRAMVAEGRFQEDLYYRLSVIPIELPPLRNRAEDIPLLIEHFVRKHVGRTGKPIERVDPRALEALQEYAWPGNVRELENTIERAVVLATGPVIDAALISLHGAGAPPGAGLPSLRLHANLEWAERESIARALRQAGGVKKDAAELLGLSQRALSHYLAKHRIE